MQKKGYKELTEDFSKKTEANHESFEQDTLRFENKSNDAINQIDTLKINNTFQDQLCSSDSFCS